MPLIKNTNVGVTDTGSGQTRVERYPGGVVRVATPVAGGGIKSYTGQERSYGVLYGKDPTPTPVVPKNPTDTGGSTGSSGYVYSGGGGGGGNSGPSALDQIMSLLKQQQEAAENYYKTLYEQELAKSAQLTRESNNAANLARARTDRYLNQLYGGYYGGQAAGTTNDQYGLRGTNYNGNISGTGLRSRAANYQNWNKAIATNRRDAAQRDSTALANYNLNLANARNAYLQGWMNYVLPYQNM